MKKNLFNFYFILFFFSNYFCAEGKELNLGQKIFIENCNVCHQDGTNIIIPEKNLQRESLKTNGMDNIISIKYQITNGKNGMPAFGGRLSESEIGEVSNYVVEKFLLEKTN